MRELPFIDGVDHYSQSLQDKKWDWVSQLSVTPGAGRFGDQALTTGPFGGAVTGIRIANSSRSSNITCGVAYKCGFFFSGLQIFRFNDADSSNSSAALNVEFDGRLSWNVSRFAPGTAFKKVSSITGKSLHIGTYYLIEADITVHGAEPTSTVDGNIWIDNENVLSFTGEAWNQGVPVLTPFKFDTILLQAGASVAYDDLYFANGYHPNSRVIRLKPTGDNLVNWQTPSVGSHYIKVDEDLTDTSDFIATTRTGDIDDFDTEDLPASIIASGPELVQNVFYGHGQDRIIHRFNALEQDGVYDVFSVWCRGGISTGTVNAATQGVKVDV